MGAHRRLCRHGTPGEGPACRGRVSSLMPRTPRADVYGTNVPLKMVTDVTGTVFSWMDTVLVPLPVALARLPVPPVTVQASVAEPLAIPFGVITAQSTPSPASVT